MERANRPAETPFGEVSTRIRLWFSYQRYALLVLGLSTTLPALVYAWAPGAWYLWGPIAAIGLYGCVVAGRILGKFGHKLRVTTVYVRRYARNGFNPTLLERYADDPCYRVVCLEIMSASGVPADERRDHLRALKEAASRPMVFVRDPESGALVERKPKSA